ncbi:MAG: hypothetical protein DRP76_03635 [Candidatus Omnitrophota bacterium]|nr:MAG: hypothetical protein DRP76_03635 [Candidatus Omnitrophota bacterium]
MVAEEFSYRYDFEDIIELLFGFRFRDFEFGRGYYQEDIHRSSEEETRWALEELGLEEGATMEEIKRQYWKLARKYHPDAQYGKTEEERKGAEEKFKRITHAYQILKRYYQNSSSSIKNDVTKKIKIEIFSEDIMVSPGEVEKAGRESLWMIVKGCIAAVVVNKSRLALVHIWASGMNLENTFKEITSFLKGAVVILITAIDKKERKKEIGLISIEEIEKYLRGNKVKRIIIDEIPQYILPQLGEIAVKVSPEGKVSLFYLDEGFKLLGVKIYEIRKKDSSSVKERSVIKEWIRGAKRGIQEKEGEKSRKIEKILEETRKIVKEVFGIEIPENEESIFVYLREKFSPQEFAEKLKEAEKRVEERLGKRLEEIFNSFMGVEPSGRDRETLEAIIEANAMEDYLRKGKGSSPVKRRKNKFAWIIEEAFNLYNQSLSYLKGREIPVDEEIKTLNSLIEEYSKMVSSIASVDDLEKINF